MKSLIALYRHKLQSVPFMIPPIAPCKLADQRPGPYRTQRNEIQHLLWMLDEMEAELTVWEAGGFIGEMKFNRWLGFVQGWFWRMQMFTIDELREQTRKALA